MSYKTQKMKVKLAVQVITGSTRFAKKFCAVRWVENVDVASRALEVLPNVKTSVLSAADSVVKLSTVDVTSKENWCSYKDVDIGVAG